MDTPNSVRVISLNGFTDNEGVSHPYGQEFAEPEGERLTGWLKDGHVRVDDRGRRPVPAKVEA